MAQITDVVGAVREFGKPNQWLVDSEATVHCTNNRRWFKELSCTNGLSMRVANEEVLKVPAMGTVKMEIRYNGKWVN